MPRFAPDFNQLSSKKKADLVINQVEQIYDKRVIEMKIRNAPEPKIKLFSPLKKKTNLTVEKDTYDWKEETPYDTNQAIEELDKVDEEGKKSDEHMALLKAFKKKMANSNIHFS